MWLIQKKITFHCEKLPKEIQEELDFDSVLLIVNGNKTTVKLSQLFLKINEWEILEESNKLIIEGYSILSLVNSEGEFVIGEKPIKLTFESEEFGVMRIIAVKNPLFQANDKKLPDEDFKKFEAKILELSEAPKVEDNSGGIGSPHSDPPELIKNKNYEINKPRFLENGFKEFKEGNYRLLLKEKDDKTTVMFFELISEAELVSYPNIAKEANSESNFIAISEDKQEKIAISLIEDVLKVEKTPVEIV